MSIEAIAAAAAAAALKQVAAALLKQGVGIVLPEGRLRDLLGRDPTRLAFASALVRALNKFNAQHRDLWLSLGEQVLAGEVVAGELALFFTRHRFPSASELARVWMDQGRFAPQHASHLQSACEDFLSDLEDELKNERALQEVFDARAREDQAHAVKTLAYATGADWYSQEIWALEQKLIRPFVGQRALLAELMAFAGGSEGGVLAC